MTCDKPVIVEHVFLGRKSTLLDSYLREMPLYTWSLFNHHLLHVTKIYRLYEERADLKTCVYHPMITRYYFWFLDQELTHIVVLPSIHPSIFICSKISVCYSQTDGQHAIARPCFALYSSSLAARLKCDMKSKIRLSRSTVKCSFSSCWATSLNKKAELSQRWPHDASYFLGRPWLCPQLLFPKFLMDICSDWAYKCAYKIGTS